jgi:hypothetical protein
VFAVLQVAPRLSLIFFKLAGPVLIMPGKKRQIRATQLITWPRTSVRAISFSIIEIAPTDVGGYTFLKRLKTSG